MDNWKQKGISNPLKARTGIEGLDEITHGGLPRGGTTLIEGGPGSGKTLLSLQSLVNGARINNEPAIFVAFEETAEQVTKNAAAFGWNLEELQKKKLFFLDAKPTLDIIQSGTFDLGGMLAALTAKTKQMKARRIVFDAVDVLLALLHDPAAERREMHRLYEWLLANKLTAIITAKAGDAMNRDISAPRMNFMQYMVDCSVVLSHEIVDGVSQRNLRVAKYRGSAFAENESPYLIGDHGLEVAGEREVPGATLHKVTAERISTGIDRLDGMLAGGYYRAASILITGLPGTAKSTLSGAFAEAAAGRGERTLFISFDSDASEVVRNLASVGIRLERFMTKGVLRLVSGSTIRGSSETHFREVKKLVLEHDARCVVIDPISSFLMAGSSTAAQSVAERLINWAKARGITLFCTSLLDHMVGPMVSTPVQISTMADTWIHLSYLVHLGERNRALSIVKSRGTAHSNQVRELILSDSGVTLADAYTAGGEVLMGTLRWEKENADHAAREELEVVAKQKAATLESEEALLEVRLKAVQLELVMKRAEKDSLNRVAKNRSVGLAREQSHLDTLRGADIK